MVREVIRIRISKIPKGGNQNTYIEEEQTTQWSKEKVQKDKQRSTKHTYKTNDRGTRTPLKNGCELRCFGREILDPPLVIGLYELLSNPTT
jgi:hypothetical protein